MNGFFLFFSTLAAVFAFVSGWYACAWHQLRARKLISWRVADSQYTNCSKAVELRYSDGAVIIAYHTKGEGWYAAGREVPRHVWNDAERAVFCHRNGLGINDPNIEGEVEAILKRMREPS